jgi:ketosteroid isomerase-like protein
MNERDHIQIREAIALRMASFEAAERALDASALVEHFSDAGDFYMHNDGQRLDLEAVAGAVRSAFPTLSALEGGFVDLEVHVLASNAALATARFRERIITSGGTTARQQGAASWLWRLRGTEWKIAYGHVDHYPDSTPDAA